AHRREHERAAHGPERHLLHGPRRMSGQQRGQRPRLEASVSPASPAAPAVMTVKPPIRASSTTSASHWDSSEESLERSPRVTSGAVVIAGAGGAAGETNGVAPAAGDVSGLGDGRSWMTPGATG